MAQRRCLHTLTRQAIALFSSSPASLRHSLRTLPSMKTLLISKSSLISSTTDPTWPRHPRHFSSNSRDDTENEEEFDDEEEEEEEDDDDYDSDAEDSDGMEVTGSSNLKREYSPEEKAKEAAEIGYKVVGPLQKCDRVFKAYKPVFAVVQIGSHQFKVSNGDSIYTERLKFCEVNDKLILNKVLLVGSSTQTIVGRPMLPDAAVHAVVEEHALDAKVIIFKKKRRKNYRRTKGHRQELTRLRITDIQGIEKPELKVDTKPKKATVKEQEKVAVAA